MRAGQPLSPWWCSSRARSGALGAGPAYAGFSEHIVDYHSDVTIEHDGTIEVHETIVYDFGVVPKHGIFRTIPVRTSVSRKDGYDRVYPLDRGVGERLGRHARAVHASRKTATTSGSRSAIPTARSPASTPTTSCTACAAR